MEDMSWTVDEVQDEDLPPEHHHDQATDDPPDLPPLESE